jgi:ketosteroid isomerase-like protein
MYVAAIRVLTVCLTILGLNFAMAGMAMSQGSDLDQVKAANQAYYTALSARDLAAMERVWSKSSRDVNIAPPIKPAAHTGWDTIKKQYQSFWGTLDELTVSMADPKIVVHRDVAWVYGIEQARRKPKGGEVSEGQNFGTSIFVKEGGRWVMVFHQAALIPGRK